jgi:hypothetical protein
MQSMERTIPSNEYDGFTLEEARRRWLECDELPIGPNVFLALCAAHKIRVTPHESEVLCTHVTGLYTRQNAFGVLSLGEENRPKRMPNFARLSLQLSAALRGIVPESQLRLRVNMVPKPLHGNNLRRALSKSVWSELRRSLIAERGCRCEICGTDIPNQTDVDAHEEWEYDAGKRPASAALVAIRLACPRCHATVHFGLQFGLVHAGKLPASHLEEIEAHFCAVNKVSKAMFDMHVNAAIERWNEFSRRRSWRVEFGSYQQLVESSRRPAIVAPV